MAVKCFQVSQSCPSGRAKVEFENSEWKFKIVMRFAGVSFDAT
jgi:hypothetical protein